MLGQVRREREGLGAQGDRLAPLAVVVQRRLVIERAVQVGVEERDPAVGRLDDDDREDVGVRAVAVQVGGGAPAQWQLAQLACVPRSGAGDPRDPTRAGEHVSSHGHGPIGRRPHRRERHHTFAGEVPQVQDLGRACAGQGEPRHPGVYP